MYVGSFITVALRCVAKSVLSGSTTAIPSGGVLVNDALFHFGNYFVPFGGVGSSGLGGYHGASFATALCILVFIYFLV